MCVARLPPSALSKAFLKSFFTPSRLTMGRFPQNFTGLLTPVVTLEAAAGVFKSKFSEMRLFWTALLVEIACAATQSAALIITAVSASYSLNEIAAAYLTVTIDAVLLLFEGCMALVAVQHESDAGGGIHCMSAYAAMVLGVSGLPIFLARVQGRASKRFKSHVPGKLMLSLPLLVASAGMAFFFSFLWATHSRTVVRVIMNASLLSLICVSIALGTVILQRSENLSLAFLVISNLYPALLTFVVIGLRVIFME